MSDPRVELVARGYDEIADLRDEIVTFVEADRGDASFEWILARR